MKNFMMMITKCYIYLLLSMTVNIIFRTSSACARVSARRIAKWESEQRTQKQPFSSSQLYVMIISRL